MNTPDTPTAPPRGRPARRTVVPRRRRLTPAKPISPEVRALIDNAPPPVRAALHLIVAERMTRGRGPDKRAVWGCYWTGDPHRWPRPGRYVIRTDRAGRRRRRSELADVGYTLEALRPYGVRYLPQGRRSVALNRPAYEYLRPAVEAELRAAGRWAFHRTPGRWFRGPRRVTP